MLPPFSKALDYLQIICPLRYSVMFLLKILYVFIISWQSSSLIIASQHFPNPFQHFLKESNTWYCHIRNLHPCFWICIIVSKPAKTFSEQTEGKRAKLAQSLNCPFFLLKHSDSKIQRWLEVKYKLIWKLTFLFGLAY